jgi:putative ABC transport system permease protein
VAVASWLLPALLAAAPVQLPRAGDVRIDTAVLFFALAATAATSLLFGLLPALRMSREDPQTGLRDGAGSGRARSLASMGLLVSFDAAVAFLLLFGAGLLVRSTAKLLLVDPGFSTARTAKLEIDLSGQRYSENPQVAAYFERVLERVRAVPGVETAGVSSMLPLGGAWDSYGIRVEGHEPANPNDEPEALRYGVSPGYLETMGIPVLRGRAFTAADREGSLPVALVTEEFARRPGEDPIGRRMGLGDHPFATVVGVVGEVRHRGLDVRGGRQVYVPASQWPDNGAVLVVRFAGDPLASLPAVRAAARSVDPDQPITRVATLGRVVEEAAGTRKFAMSLLAGFAALATLLAAVGIYGVVSAYVSRRTREIGIRIALGATPATVVWTVVREGFALSMAGLAVGVVLSIAAGAGMRAITFGNRGADVMTVGGAMLVLLLAAIAASWIPARRAARVEPTTALRAE